MTVADELDAALARVIRDHRQVRGLSMDALASAAGLHRTSLGLIERGARGLSVSAAHRLAKALGMSLSTLVEEAEQRLERG